MSMIVHQSGSRVATAAGQNPPALIELRQVVKTYTSPAGSFSALKGVDLVIHAGQLLTVIGKSGSGKSTLLNMLTGIDRPTSGDVVAASTSLRALSESGMARWRGRTVGIVFQFFQLLPTLTVIENLMLAMDFCGVIPIRERQPRARRLLEQVAVADQAHKLPAMLSGGQQQRVAVARALVNDPPIVVADEPTGNLDTETAAAILELLRAEAADGKAVVIVTHDRDLAARADRMITLADGRIVEERGS